MGRRIHEGTSLNSGAGALQSRAGGMRIVHTTAPVGEVAPLVQWVRGRDASSAPRRRCASVEDAKRSGLAIVVAPSAAVLGVRPALPRGEVADVHFSIDDVATRGSVHCVPCRG